MEQNNKTQMKKQYTTIRILTDTHRKIKIIALSEQRTIDNVANRILNEVLMQKDYANIIDSVLRKLN